MDNITIGSVETSTAFFDEEECKGADPKFPERELHPLRVILCDSMGDEKLADLIHTVLENQGLDRFEKKLGNGAFGNVIQLDGTGLYEGKKLALKLIPKLPYSLVHPIGGISASSSSSFDSTSQLYQNMSSWSLSESWSSTEINTLTSPVSYREVTWISQDSSPISQMPSDDIPESSCSLFSRPSDSSPDTQTLSSELLSEIWSISRIARDKIIGDGLALNFSHRKPLIYAYGLLLYNGEDVEYTESVDFERHQGMAVIGVVSPAASGGSLFGRVNHLDLHSEDIKSYGKRLAQAIHELHEQGYAHRDIHMGNILLDTDSDGKYRPLLGDFGLCRRISIESTLTDWKDYSFVMRRLLEKSTGEKGPEMQEFLSSLEDKISTGSLLPSDEKELLSHHCFA